MSACPRCQSPTETSDLRCSICAYILPEAEDHDRVEATILRCDGCGAAITYDVHAQAPKCVFCDSVMHLEKTLDPIEEAEAYLPFRVSPDQAQAALRSWLSTLGYFRPTHLSSQATLDKLTPLWWVGWTFDVDAMVHWTADSDLGSRRSRWAPHSGKSPLSLRSALVSASKGLSREETSKLARAFDLRTATKRPHEMPGAFTERFDARRSAARAAVAKSLRAQAKYAAKNWVPGSRTRNVNVSLLPTRLITRRFAFPTYVATYRYGSKVYRAIVHGQDSRVTFGDAPYSIWKIVGAILLALLAIIVISFGIATIAARA